MDVFRFKQEGEKVHEKQQLVLIRCANDELETHPCLGSSDKNETTQYSRMDFHMVDLNLDRILTNCLPKLLWVQPGNGRVVSLGDSVYVISTCSGGLDPATTNNPDNIYYLGGSRCDLGDPETKAAAWKQIPVPIGESFVPPSVVSLSGKLYTFGYRLFPEVYDPIENKWSQLLHTVPTLLEDCVVSVRVVTDPSNNRILLHLERGKLKKPSLYAFYPDHAQETVGANNGTSAWVCLDSSFYDWSDLVTVEDDVLYYAVYEKKRFHYRAYDLKSKKMLDIKWGSRLMDFDIELFEFDAYINFGNGMLCLAGFTPYFDARPPRPYKNDAIFVKFKVKRDSDSVICASGLSLQSYTLPATAEVFDYIQL